jgi:hypothetical protein
MMKKQPSPNIAQRSSNSREEAMKASMYGAKKVADTSNSSKQSKEGKNTMATKKASAKKMMAKPAQAAPKATGMTAAQKKLPAFIQKSIMAKNKAKKK